MKRNHNCKSRGRMLKVLGLFGLVGAVLFFSGCHHRSFEDKVEWMKDRVSSKLDLNEQQEAKLDTVAAQVVAARSENAGKKEEFFAEIKKMILSDRISSKQVSAMIDEKRRLHAVVDIRLYMTLSVSVFPS